MPRPIAWDTAEPLCGEADPLGREDTANKYAKTLWTNLTAEHQESDGAHRAAYSSQETGSYSGSQTKRTITLDDPNLAIETLYITSTIGLYGPIFARDDMVELLTHADQKLGIVSGAADESTTFTDIYGTHTITPYGGVKYDDAINQGWFDTAIYFDGTDDYLSVADHADWDFGTGAFTIQFDCYFLDKAANAKACFLDHDDWRIWYDDSLSEITLTIEGTAYHYPWSPQDGLWYTVYVVHTTAADSGFLNIYVNNSILPATETDVTPITGSSNPLTIGCDTAQTAAYFFNGYMDDIFIGSNPTISSPHPRANPFVSILPYISTGTLIPLKHEITRLGTGKFQLSGHSAILNLINYQYTYLAIGVSS